MHYAHVSEFNYERLYFLSFKITNNFSGRINESNKI